MFKWFEKLIKNIEKANEESFKGTRMDCCELNKNNKGKTKSK